MPRKPAYRRRTRRRHRRRGAPGTHAARGPMPKQDELVAGQAPRAVTSDRSARRACAGPGSARRRRPRSAARALTSGRSAAATASATCCAVEVLGSCLRVVPSEQCLHVGHVDCEEPTPTLAFACRRNGPNGPCIALVTTCVREGRRDVHAERCSYDSKVGLRSNSC